MWIGKKLGVSEMLEGWQIEESDMFSVGKDEFFLFELEEGASDDGAVRAEARSE